MKRIMNLLLIVLGAGLLSAGPLTAMWYAPAALLPDRADYYVVTAKAPEATYADLEAGAVREHKLLTLTQSFRGNTALGDPKTAVFDTFTQIVDGSEAVEAGNARVVAAWPERFAWERETLSLSPCCGTHVDNVEVSHEGFEHRLPQDMDARDYDYYDAKTTAAYPMTYVSTLEMSGNDAVNGMRLYQFRQKIPTTVVETLKVPAHLVQQPEPGADTEDREPGEGTPHGDEQVEVERTYRMTRDIFVEPQTGIVVRLIENREDFLRKPGTEETLATALDATFTWTTESVTRRAEAAREMMADVQLYTQTLPIVFGVLGTVLLGAGVVLFWRADNASAVRHRKQRSQKWF